MAKNWVLEKETGDKMRWRNAITPKVTVEIVSFISQEIYDVPEQWGYGYLGVSGRSVTHTPEFFETKKEGVKWANDTMKKYPRGYMIKYK